MEFSEQLITLRKELGISRKELSEMLEIPIPSIRRWELAISVPPKYVQNLLLKAIKRTGSAQSLDIEDQRFGQLVAIEPTNKRAGTSVVWICRCDCGKTCEKSVARLKSGKAISCGCGAKLTRDKHFYPRTERDEEICSKYKSGMTLEEIGEKLNLSKQRIYQILTRLLKEKSAPRKERESAVFSRNTPFYPRTEWHKMICELYVDGKTCSEIATQLGIAHQSVYSVLKYTSKEKPVKKPIKRQISESVRIARAGYAKKALEARLVNGTHYKGKYWVIQSPTGEIYEFNNLLSFTRENAELFDGTPERARAGIAAIKSSMQGKCKYPVSQWKGWRLLEYEE